MKLLNNDTYLLLIDEGAERIDGQLQFCEDVHDGNLVHEPEQYINPIRKWCKTDTCKDCNKIIAYHPLQADSKELDLPLLPSPYKEEVDVEKFVQDFCKNSDNINYDAIKDQVRVAFIQKDMELIYKAANNKQYSLEDMESCFKAARSYRMKNVFEFENVKDYIESLSSTVLPVSFEAEYNIIGQCNCKCHNLGPGEYMAHMVACCYPKKELKTTTKDGKTYLVGEYKY